MKTWNAPVVDEMNVQATANGIFCSDAEFCIFTHEHKGCDQDKDKDQTERDS